MGSVERLEDTMVIASMGRKLGLFAAACALGLGLAAGAAAQQALAIDLH